MPVAGYNNAENDTAYNYNCGFPQVPMLASKPEPNMLKCLPIIPTSTSQKITHYSYFILKSLYLLFSYCSFTLLFRVLTFKETMN